MRKGGERIKNKEGEEHLGHVVDGEGEQENHGAVEEQFAQTNQQVSRLQTGLHKRSQHIR